MSRRATLLISVATMVVAYALAGGLGPVFAGSSSGCADYTPCVTVTATRSVTATATTTNSFSTTVTETSSATSTEVASTTLSLASSTTTSTVTTTSTTTTAATVACYYTASPANTGAYFGVIPSTGSALCDGGQ